MFSLEGVHFLLGRSTVGAGGLEIAVQEALAGGVRVFQLRDKQADFAALQNQMQLLLNLLDQASRTEKESLTLIINDEPQLALTLGKEIESRTSPLRFGLHLGQKDLARLAQQEAKILSDVRRQLGKRAVLGLSLESVEQLRQAATRQALSKIDYLGAGPVFATASKPDAAPAFGLAGLAEICQAVKPLPVIAIGGIQPATALLCREAGARGVAVISALAGERNRTQVAQELGAAFKPSDFNPTL